MNVVFFYKCWMCRPVFRRNNVW